LALTCTVSEIERDIAANSQLQLHATLVEASSYGLSKNWSFLACSTRSA